MAETQVVANRLTLDGRIFDTDTIRVADDVQTKSADWMKKNANKGIQVLNDEGEQICVIGRNGTVYAKAFKSLEELPA